MPSWTNFRRKMIGGWVDTLSPWFDARIAALLRPLPVSSRKLGPPKGVIWNLEDWIRTWEDKQPWTERGKGHWMVKVRDREWVSGRPPLTLEPELDAAFRERFRCWAPELSVTHLREARMALPEGVVISPDDRVFEAFTHNYGEPTLAHGVFRRAHLPRLEHKVGTWATIISPGAARNYAHWILDSLTRLAVLEEAGLADDATLIVPAKHDWYAESLGALGYSRSRYAEFGNGHWEFEHLLVPSFVGEPGFVRPWSARWLRRRLAVEDLEPNGERLYISRADASWRRLVNEEELLDKLVREGFRSVLLDGLSFREQVDLFSRVEYVVAPHGAGLTNLLFAPVGARVVELFAPRYVNACFYGIAVAVGLRYGYVVGDLERHTDDVTYDDLRIDPDRVLNTMQLLK